MSVAVTGLYAGMLGIVFFVLSMRVINNRVRARVNLLDGGDEALTRAMRVHGNFAEYVGTVRLVAYGFCRIARRFGIVHARIGDSLDRMPIVSRLRHNRDDGTKSSPVYWCL